MPAHRSSQAAQQPASPNAKATAKYTNKDGSKFITVPKVTAAGEASQPTTPVSTSRPPQAGLAKDTAADSAPPVNRKKQKRREKAAARVAAEQGITSPNGRATESASPGPSVGSPRSDVAEPRDSDGEETYVPPQARVSAMNGLLDSSVTKSKKSKKKKKKGTANSGAGDADNEAMPPLISLEQPVPRSGMSKEKIWNTNSHEERERIKEFWLGLGEDERKSLVKVEKNAVIKKMKEQQKHTCSCHVCGRKRTAIEEELEGLYDAYYHELEQFANNSEGAAVLGEAVANSGMRGYDHHHHHHHHHHHLRPPALEYSSHQPSRGRIVQPVVDEEDDEDYEDADAYSDGSFEGPEVDEEEELSEFDPEDDDHGHVADFLAFGKSLQVKGGILTVADDILQNDGRKFIEMMENLAERRLRREENTPSHHPLNGQYAAHPPPPPEEDDFEEEEEEEDYDDSQDESYDDEQSMTEEQRMEEGRRMFQIFAARMFEQRVLNAYKEKVAKERQAKLFEELEEEQNQEELKKAKKASKAQKKKDRAAQKKLSLAEEKAKEEEARKAKEAADRAEQLRREEEARQKQEEKRKEKEAQKKAEEAERQRRLQEQKEQKELQDRKAREAKEREKKLKEEQKQKEKEAREARERESRERKEKQERDKREKEARLKAEKEARENKHKAEKTAAKAAMLAATAVPAQPARKLSQHHTHIPAALPQHPPNPANVASPKIPVATPAIPKTSTPIRPRQLSQQQEATTSAAATAAAVAAAALNMPQPLAHSASNQSSASNPATPVHASPGPISLPKAGSAAHPSQSASPQSASSRIPSGNQGLFQLPQGPLPNPPPGISPLPPPGFQNRLPSDGTLFNAVGSPAFPPGFRPPMPPPPGIIPPGRGYPTPMTPIPPPGFGSPLGDPVPVGGGFMMKDGPPASHSRQGSQSFDANAAAAMPAIGRPAPIGRPGSVVHGQHHRENERDAGPGDIVNEPLGSSALLGDSEDFLGPRRGLPHGPKTVPPGFPQPNMQGFHMPEASPFMPSNVWGAPPGHGLGFVPAPPPGLGGPMHPGPATWGPPPPPFGSPLPAMTQHVRGHPPVLSDVALRQAMIRAWQDLKTNDEDYVELAAIRAKEPHVFIDEVTDRRLMILCETEGNESNGGGTFHMRGLEGFDNYYWPLEDGTAPSKPEIRWVPGDEVTVQGFGRSAVGPPLGMIGSPVIGSGAGLSRAS